MIRVSNLIKEFGARKAINDLTFNVSKGEIVAFLGPNGAGKTTTMRILTGYLPPTSGKVEIGGFDIYEQSLAARKIIGYLPETVPLYPDLTPYEYLDYMAALRKIKQPDKRIREVLDQVHLAHRSGGYISRLSKGMRQRVGLAQALLHKPLVLILDEPTIGLDPGQIHEVRNLIKEVGEERTVMLSTHILSEAQQTCNRVLIINNGSIVVEDTTEHLQMRVSGSQKVFLRIRGDASSALETVKKIPGILEAKITGDDSIEFDSFHSEDTRPLVARALVSAGYDLLQLQPSNLSLEDIFLQLTSETLEGEGSLPSALSANGK